MGIRVKHLIWSRPSTKVEEQMGAKLSELVTIKAQLKAAIIAKGQSVSDSTPIEDYVGKVAAIQTGTPITGKKTVSGTAKEALLAGDTAYKKYFNNPVDSQQEAISSDFSFGSGNGKCVEYTTDGEYIAFGMSAAPYVIIYKKVGSSWVNQTIDAVTAVAPQQMAWTVDKKYLAVVDGTNFTAYRNNFDGTFTKLTTALGYTISQPYTVAALSSGHLVIHASISSTSYMCLIKISSGDAIAIVSRVSVVSMTSGFHTIGVSPDGVYIATMNSYTTSGIGIKIIKRTGDTIVSLKDLAAPAVQSYFGLAYTPDGTKLIGAVGTSPRVFQYNISGEDYTLQSNPATLPADTVLGMVITRDSKWAVFSKQSSSTYYIYEITSTGLVHRSTIVIGTGSSSNKGAVSPDGRVFTGVVSTPTCFKNLLLNPTNELWKANNLLVLAGNNVSDVGYVEDNIALDAVGNMVSIVSVA